MIREWTERAGWFIAAPAPVHRWAVVLLAVLLYACGKEEVVPELFVPDQAHEAYLFGLRQAGLADTALGQDWVEASQRALEAPQQIELPFREAVYLDPGQPAAFGYRFATRRGQVVEVLVEEQSSQDLRLFIDIFRPREEESDPFVLIASATEKERQAQFEPRDDNEYIVRVQPELLRGGSFTLRVETQPVFDFPVKGHSIQSIQSVFGAPRDAGRRRHHGVDIFARRHTPVIAPSRAYVRRVGENRLGGNVVWLRDSDRSLTMYFAHLQEQRVEEGTWVEKGQIIGTVGNSGNARTTPTHLHFGLYRRPEGPIDPYYYLYSMSQDPSDVALDRVLLGRWARPENNGTRLRQSPGSRTVLRDLDRDMPLQIVGAADDYFKVRLPDGSSGYVLARLLEPDPSPLVELQLEQGAPLLNSPSPGAIAIGRLPAGAQVAVFGQFSDFRLIQQQPGRMVWLREKGTRSADAEEE